MHKKFFFLSCALLCALMGLLLPGLLRLLALAAALLLPLCARPLWPDFSEAGWQVTRRGDRGPLRSVCVEEALLIGPPDYTAAAALPLTPVPPERFRAQSGAMLLTAAAALTAPSLQDRLPDAALCALSIRPDNVRRQYPVLETYELNGFPGVIVRDGKGMRAFFAGDAALSEACSTIYDRAERPLTTTDRAAISDMGGVHFAAAPVVDGVPGKAMYLGSIVPHRLERVHPEALAAIRTLHADGLTVVCPDAGNALRATGLSLPTAPEGDALFLRTTGPDRDFAIVVQHYLAAAQARTSWLRTVRYAGLTGAVIAMAAGAYLSLTGAALTTPFALGYLLCAALLALLPALRQLTEL